jgi:hypothetical protein
MAVDRLHPDPSADWPLEAGRNSEKARAGARALSRRGHIFAEDVNQALIGNALLCRKG